MAAFRIGPDVVAKASLEVGIRRDGAAPERLHLNLFRFLAEAAPAFGLDPKLVEVAAIPALRVPEIAVLAIMNSRFELVDHHSVIRSPPLLDPKVLACPGHDRKSTRLNSSH